jgi:hypothetical protein
MKDFIPYQQALDLKELGFDESCLASYVKETKEFTTRSFADFYKDQQVLAPLYQQAFRWFREKYQLHSYIEGAYPWFRFYINTEDNRYEGHKHLSFEEAELACLIKLIEIVKNKTI